PMVDIAITRHSSARLRASSFSAMHDSGVEWSMTRGGPSPTSKYSMLPSGDCTNPRLSRSPVAADTVTPSPSVTGHDDVLGALKCGIGSAPDDSDPVKR